MSLINNLLKDIEKRETRVHALPYISLTNTPTQRRVSLSFSHTLFLGTAVASFVMLMTVFILTRHAVTERLPSFVDSQTITDSTNSLVDPIYLQPVSITGITLQTKSQKTEIGLLLSHAGLYRIISHNDRNELSLIIDHAQLQSALPSFNYANSAIERITSSNINGDTRIDIYLLPGAILNYLDQNIENNNAQIILGISASIQPNTNEQSSNLAAKPNLIKIPDANSLVIQQYHQALQSAEKGDYSAALQQLETIVQAEPGYKDARVSYAALLLDQGNAARAKQVVEQGLMITPAYVPLIELKARLMTLDGKLKQALTYLEMNPPPLSENPQYHAFIAALYEQTNQYLSAFKLYKQLLQLDSSNSNWWMGLGISLEKLHQPKSAISAYAKAMQVGNLDVASVNYLQDRLQALREDANEKS